MLVTYDVLPGCPDENFCMDTLSARKYCAFVEARFCAKKSKGVFVDFRYQRDLQCLSPHEFFGWQVHIVQTLSVQLKHLHFGVLMNTINK